ncbi:MAG: hypothetical protein NPIRA02_30650 [Nitrospirales bacterium]|nr:MAG: hypothetical protein NPIRA02_30650 [Nitrospirales bacterium]
MSSTNELFKKTEPPLYDTSDFLNLRNHYLSHTKERILEKLRIHGNIGYDDIWDLALSAPLIWESDLKKWLREWKESGLLEFAGLADRQRVPKYGANNRLVLKEKSVQ